MTPDEHNLLIQAKRNKYDNLLLWFQKDTELCKVVGQTLPGNNFTIFLSFEGMELATVTITDSLEVRLVEPTTKKQYEKIEFLHRRKCISEGIFLMLKVAGEKASISKKLDTERKKSTMISPNQSRGSI